jgi:hypothetical protein
MEDYNDIELEEAKALVGDILETHWTGILKAVTENEDQIGSVSIALKLDHSGPTRNVKVKLSYAVKTTDETEKNVRNPAQQELAI